MVNHLVAIWQCFKVYIYNELTKKIFSFLLSDYLLGRRNYVSNRYINFDFNADSSSICCM